jgi:23S rRNA C2498 (ribose-2'-O)-methylase RlmM
MDLQERFRKVINVKQEYEQIMVRRREEREAEIRKTNEAFIPKIEKVCREFAKALRWKYSANKCFYQNQIYHGNSFHLLNTSGQVYIGICVKINAEQVDVPPRAIVVTGSSSFADYGPTDFFSRVIPFNEFTEEELAKALEDAFRAYYRTE